MEGWMRWWTILKKVGKYVFLCCPPTIPRPPLLQVEKKKKNKKIRVLITWTVEQSQNDDRRQRGGYRI